jgi:hypothetical protein
MKLLLMGIFLLLMSVSFLCGEESSVSPPAADFFKDAPRVEQDVEINQRLTRLLAERARRALAAAGSQAAANWEARWKTVDPDPAPLMNHTLFADAARWDCYPQITVVCGPLECTTKPVVIPLVSVSWDNYTRCDSKGCMAWPAKAEVGGIFTIVAASAGASIKMFNDGSAFVDTTSFLLVVLVNYGYCEPRLP